MTAKQHKEWNEHVNSSMTKDSFVKARTESDAKLAAPRLLYQSLQINATSGKLLEVDEDRQRMLKVPLRVEDPQAW
mgnify:CR=1 FL=1